MGRLIPFAPLLVIALVIGAMVWRLENPSDTVTRSKLLGTPVPQFALPPVVADKPPLGSTDLATGTPRLLNLFASWCVPCIAEAPVLAELRRRGARIDGIAIRDRPEDVARFLKRHGDPFEKLGADDHSRVQLALGSSGVPETFVIDGRGIIRFQHVGPIMPDDIRLLLGELEKAR